MTETTIKYSPDVDDGIDVGLPAKVILFNDEVHTFDDVIVQIIKAVGCSYDKAETLTWEVHLRGKAVVFFGEISECLKVSGVLEEIALHTQIES
ncbi:MAG: ATP-dependent Clp protease adaptor ClpS [Bacteroidetes bacterium]|nr:ATP-dependent Clp protease adaptor ClpS [Bacteroidota bacterium]MBU2585469.1 ATP-dependent Clp protease adaptor ClpS [Bacteroidota bacterium]